MRKWHTLDEAEDEDPFQVSATPEVEMEPPDEEDAPEDVQVRKQLLEPMQVPLPATDYSWWQRVGESVELAALRVGGAALHPTHMLAHFGTLQCRLVFCVACGGTTAGTFSPLLAEPCRHEASATRQRQLNRMLQKHQWPTGALQDRFGRGDLSTTIAFTRLSGTSCRIRDATSACAGATL